MEEVIRMQKTDFGRLKIIVKQACFVSLNKGKEKLDFMFLIIFFCSFTDKILKNYPQNMELYGIL